MLAIATLISRVFEPMLVLAIVATIGGFRAGLSADAFIKYILLVYGFMVLPLTLFRIWLVGSKRVSDWDMSKRSERIKPLMAVIFLVIIDWYMIRALGNQSLDRLFTLFVVWMLGFASITLLWKISGHTGVTALSLGLIVQWFGVHWWPILLIVPLMGWARVMTKNHTINQVIGGALYSGILLLFYEIR